MSIIVTYLNPIPMKRIFTLCSLFLFNYYQSIAQLTIDNTTLTPTYLVTNVLVGGGVSVSNVKFNGSVAAALAPNVQAGQFTGPTSIGLSNGVILGSGNVQLADSDNNSSGATLGPPTGTPAVDPDLNALSGLTLYDEAVLEFDFVPAGDSLIFKYVFASEEYLEWCGSGFNDVFGFFLSGPGIAGPYSAGGINLAVVPSTTTPITINTINNVTNPTYYVDNGTGSTPAINLYIQYDGHTVVMTAKAAVNCGDTYHIKLAISDAGDGVLDSGVFLEAGSFSSNAIDVTVATPTSPSFINGQIYENCILGTTATFYLVRPASVTAVGDTISFTYTGSATVGLDYSSSTPDTFAVFPAGQDTATFSVTILNDGIPEGIDSLVITVYNINTCGDTVLSTGTLYIHDPLIIVTDAGLDDTINCATEVVNLTATATGSPLTFSYSWTGPGLGVGDTTLTASFVPGGNATIIFYAVDACGFNDADTMQIVLVPIAVIADAGLDQTSICPSDPANLTGSALSGIAPFTYGWSNGATTANTTVTPATTTSYILTVTDNCLTVDTDTMTVTIPNPIPYVLTYNPTENVTCPGDPISLTVTVVSGGVSPYTYAWNNGDVDNIGDYTIITTPTTATLVIDDVCGMDTTISIVITYPIYAPIQVSALGGELCLNSANQVLIPVSTTGGAGGNVYTWICPTGSSATYDSNLGTGIVVSPVSGLYTVIVTDLCGSSGQDTITVEVIPCDITIPNIVTPNGDNTNDVFYITNLEYHPNSYVAIFNRWGQLMYENANYLNDYSPRDLTDGVYFYVVKLTDGTVPDAYNGTLQVAKH